MRRFLRHFSVWFALLYLLPVGVAAGMWFAQDRPMSWRQADWSSSGQLAAPGEAAEIRVYTARAGRYKGIVAVHSWLLVKQRGARAYDRYEVVGWGDPVRRNAYVPDARWFSNEPELLAVVRGAAAEEIAPKVLSAIRSYPYSKRGTYQAWPGPNSNTFVAHVLNEVAEIGAVLPPTAVGKDFPVDGSVFRRTADGFRLSAGGLASLTIGLRAGIELNLLGLVAGFDILRPALKLPGIGRLGLPASEA
ncbi:MAG: DUF3750 domain-containing protein [Rhodobiaceae bacterium]|nr:DUF3750 domain-containing protein [Rhodobiaceae bacterium]MCC0053866.1 DUF3750 domain-containing protein [Rhodobiaceae bacterium]